MNSIYEFYFWFHNQKQWSVPFLEETLLPPNLKSFWINQSSCKSLNFLDTTPDITACFTTLFDELKNENLVVFLTWKEFLVTKNLKNSKCQVRRKFGKDVFGIPCFTIWALRFVVPFRTRFISFQMGFLGGWHYLYG